MSPSIKTKNFFLSAAPLFLVLFIDSMGLGLVFPILNDLIFDPKANFISTGLSPATHNFLYGFIIGIYMFCWFFGAAFLGKLSDQIGRKKSIMICLLGTFFGYLFSIAAVIFSSFTLLLVGRMAAGFTAGSQAIAQAAIVDLSEPQHKTRNLGLILFFCSLGFIFGPLIGGVLSDTDLIPWFSYAMPFYFSAIISLINAVLLSFLFKETFTTPEKITIKLHYAIEIFVSAFKNEKIRNLSFSWLIIMFGWSCFYSFISMYLFHVYHFPPLKIGLYMGLMGVGFGIGNITVEFFTKRFTLPQCIIGSCSVVALATLLTVIASHENYIWFYDLIISIGMAFAYSTFLTLLSNQVDADSQGWIMGISGSIMAFAFGVSGLLLGLLSDFSPALPLYMTIVSLFLASVLLYNFSTTQKGSENKR